MVYNPRTGHNYQLQQQHNRQSIVTMLIHIHLHQQRLPRQETTSSVSWQHPLNLYLLIHQTAAQNSPTTQLSHVLPWTVTHFNTGRANMPMLSTMACKYLTIPASSAPVERIFSIAGKIFRPERCRLNDQTFERLMMIKCNSKLPVQQCIY